MNTEAFREGKKTGNRHHVPQAKTGFKEGKDKNPIKQKKMRGM